jgi:hypothetical protein
MSSLAPTATTVKDNRLTWWVVGGAVVVVVLFFVAAFLSTPSNQGFKDASSALVLISATAVGIERIMEAFWNFVDTTRGSFWPLSEIDRKINDLVDALTTDASGPLQQLKAGIATIKRDADWTDAQVVAAQADIDAIAVQIGQLKQLAPTSDNAQAIVAVAQRGLTAVATKYPTIQNDANAAKELVGGVSDFVNSLSDNPGRRILSIYLGALMGLGVAAVLGMDVFAAVAGTAAPTAPALTKGLQFGVAATGIVMGLGSGPTHEVIKVLQALKENQNKV